MSSEPRPTPDETPEAPVLVVLCRHLRSKGMYVYTDGSDHSHDDYDNTIYWCLQSMKSFGPDDEMVNRDSCGDAARSCHQPV